MDCIFCKIAQKKLETDIVYETTELLVFRDLAPQAPIHLLVIPKKHVSTINELNDDDQLLIGKMIFAAKKLAQDMGIHETGYRLIYNVNQQGGQSVYHIHLHILGGRQMGWPPG